MAEGVRVREIDDDEGRRLVRIRTRLPVSHSGRDDNPQDQRCLALPGSSGLIRAVRLASLAAGGKCERPAASPVTGSIAT